MKSNKKNTFAKCPGTIFSQATTRKCTDCTRAPRECERNGERGEKPLGKCSFFSLSPFFKQGRPGRIAFQIFSNLPQKRSRPERHSSKFLFLVVYTLAALHINKYTRIKRVVMRVFISTLAPFLGALLVLTRVLILSSDAT